MYHCRSCQIKNTVIYLHISPHEITIISSWYPHSQCVFTSSGPFQHWEPRAVWVVEVVLRRISATWRAWVSSLGDDELKLAWFGMKGGGKKIGKYGHMNMIHHDTMFNDGLFHFFIRMVGCHRDCHNTLYTESRYSGWWLTYPSETYEFVSWDDEIPNMMGNIIQMFQSPPTSIVDHSWFFVDEVGFVQWDWSGKITPTTVVTV